MDDGMVFLCEAIGLQPAWRTQVVGVEVLRPGFINDA